MAVIKLGQLLHRATTAPIDENNPLNVTLSGTIVELARGGQTVITAGTEYAIYSTTNFDASEVTVQVRGTGKKVDIVIREYINSIAPSRAARESVISSEENTGYLITGRTKVFGRILEIYVKNTSSEDVTLSAWGVNAIKI